MHMFEFQHSQRPGLTYIGWLTQPDLHRLIMAPSDSCY